MMSSRCVATGECSFRYLLELQNVAKTAKRNSFYDLSFTAKLDRKWLRIRVVHAHMCFDLSLFSFIYFNNKIYFSFLTSIIDSKSLKLLLNENKIEADLKEQKTILYIWLDLILWFWYFKNLSILLKQKKSKWRLSFV